MKSVVRNDVCLNKGLCLFHAYEFRSSGLAVLLCNLFQCLDDEVIDPSGASQKVFSISNISLKLISVSDPVKDILLVDIAEFDLGYEFSLFLIDSETGHEVRDNVSFEFCLSDDLDSLIDIQEDNRETV